MSIASTQATSMASDAFYVDSALEFWSITITCNVHFICTQPAIVIFGVDSTFWWSKIKKLQRVIFFT